LTIGQIRELIPSLLRHAESFQVGSAEGLAVDEYRELGRRIGDLQAICDELASFGIPLTIEHGDFWAGQVILSSEGPVFLDWSDASISHPFLSFAAFGDPSELGYVLDHAETAIPVLRQAYLKAWTDWASMRELQLALDLAILVAPIRSMLIYHAQVLPNFAHPWEMQAMIPFFGRQLLSRIRGA